MIDQWGRRIDYLRISLTDRCNLRCVYCMPEEGIASVPKEEILSQEEILRLAGIFVSLGIHKIKLTGGEPLVRKNAVSIVRELKKLPGITQVTLTTNGVALAESLEALKDAGIDGINLSLDTLDRAVYEKITRRDRFEDAMRGFYTALQYPEIPLKINCVPMGIEGQRVTALAELAKNHPVHVRYIEMMPIGLGKKFFFCEEEKILQELEKLYGKAIPYEGKLGNGPGHYYTFPGFLGMIGFISAISHQFCDSCNRVRLSAGGYLKACLQYDIGIDLKEMLRKGASDEELRAAIRDTILKKPAGHQFCEQSPAHGEEHMMSQIGG